MEGTKEADMTDDRIVDYEPYGMHIPVTCKNHPEKLWSTKNISCIGARSLFYDLRGTAGMGPECNCKTKDLRPLTEDEYIAYLEGKYPLT